MADGAEFSIDVGVTGGDQAVAAASALDALASKLEVAGTAATDTANAMKAGQTAYDQAESAAIKAAAAVEKIGLAATAQSGKVDAIAAEFGIFSPQAQKAAEKLAQLTARQSEAVAKAASTSAAMTAEASALDKLKNSAAAAADKEAALTKEHAALKKSGDDAAKSAKEQADAQTKSVGAAGLLEGAFAKLGGPLGELGQKATGVGGAVLKMGKSLGAAGPYVAAAVLAIALATAFVAAGLAITKFGVESADAARTQALLADGVAGSVAGGRELDKTIEKLGNTVPQTRDELLAMAGDLAKTGLKGAALSDALEDAAVKAAKLKFGPDFAKQMLSLPSQAARLKSNIAGVFSGLNIESLLEGLSKLVALFDKNSATGEAMKVVFESVFQPIVDGLAAIIPKAVATFIQLEILAMKGLIAIKPYGGVLQGIAIGFGIVLAVIAAVVVAFVAVGVAMAAVFALFVALPFYAQSAFKAVGDGITSTFGAVVAWVSGKIDEIVGFFKGLSLSDIGTQLIQGLIDGITGGGAGVIKAITGIAGGAVDAAKHALGIASPSKVFAEIGTNTAAGMEQGVDSGAEGVQSSMTDMVEPPAPAAAAPAAPATSASTSGAGMFAGAIFNFNGVGGDAKAFAEDFKNHVSDLLAQAGGGVPA